VARRIPSDQIQNVQQIEAVVAGPDDANRLFIIDGAVLSGVAPFSTGPATVVAKETFTVLVGPVFTRKQFVKANATAFLTGTGLDINALPQRVIWQILGVDADWDDESGQVELRIEVQADCSGGTNKAAIFGFGFHVTILAEVAAA
jgi:hypothetical protein